VFRVLDSKKMKVVKSANYNSFFNKETGLFVRCGATEEDDPQMCEIGPEILDMEVSVNGCPNACPFCYKSNDNTEPTNMSFETCKAIIDKFKLGEDEIIISFEDGAIVLKESQEVIANGNIILASKIQKEDDVTHIIERGRKIAVEKLLDGQTKETTKRSEVS